MPTYSLMKLPNDMKCLEGFSFSENQIKGNKLWRVSNSPYFIHTYLEPGNTIIRKSLRRKDSIDMDFMRLSDKDMQQIFNHFIKKGEVSNVTISNGFDCNSEFYSEGYEGLKKILPSKVLFGDITEEEINKAIQEYDYMLNEEYISPEQLTLIKKTDKGVLQFTLYTSTTVGGRDFYYISKDKPQRPSKEENESHIINIIQEIMLILSLSDNTDLELMTLKEHKKVIHPLANSHKVVSVLFEKAGFNLKEELGISDEEWILIEKDLLKYTETKKDKVIYDYEKSNILIDLKN